MVSSRIRAVVAVLGILAAGGCRLLPQATTATAGNPSLAAAPVRPAVRPAPLELEVVFLRLEPHDPLFGESLWTLVDEQAIGDETRRQLAANGLRGGVISGGAPSRLANALADAAEEPSPDGPATLRVLRLLPGNRAEVVTSPARPDLVVLEHDGTALRGTTLRDASGLVALRAWPAASGRVRIEAVPEFRHGPSRRNWVGEEGAFRLETGQGSRRLDHLGIAVELPPGGLLVMAAAPEAPSSVGDALLGEPASGRSRVRQLLVVSPRNPPVDPLFADAAIPADASDR